MKKIEVIDNSVKKECNCHGEKPCEECKCGVYKEPNYTLIAEDNKGQKIAFQMDFIK